MHRVGTQQAIESSTAIGVPATISCQNGTPVRPFASSTTAATARVHRQRASVARPTTNVSGATRSRDRDMSAQHAGGGPVRDGARSRRLLESRRFAADTVELGLGSECNRAEQ
jgi:hypothetical protein